MGSPDLSIAAPFSSRSPSCTPNARRASLSAGTFPAAHDGRPVRVRVVVEEAHRLHLLHVAAHSANTAKPKPSSRTSRSSFAISASENASSESTKSSCRVCASKHGVGELQNLDEVPGGAHRVVRAVEVGVRVVAVPVQDVRSPTSSESRGMYPGGYRTEWNCDQSTPSRRGGVGATEKRTGTSTRLDRVADSPRPGGSPP